MVTPTYIFPTKKMADQTLSPTSTSPGQENKVVRRNRPGTKAKDMYSWPEQDFNDMETVLAGKCLGVDLFHNELSLLNPISIPVILLQYNSTFSSRSGKILPILKPS